MSTSSLNLPVRDNRPVILLAEDDDGVRAFVQMVLEQAGYAVVAAADGLVAGDLFAANPLQFALVLTDVLMPRATGPDLAARVRQIRPNVPVLFISGYTNIILAPSEVLIDKPFTREQLVGAVAAALGRSRPEHTTD